MLPFIRPAQEKQYDYGTLIDPWDLLSKAMPDGQLGDFGFAIKGMARKEESTGFQRRWIRGVASTPDLDLQEETIIQKGLDLRYFRQYGFFNDDHKPGNNNKVGEPTVATLKTVKNKSGKSLLGLWTEGFIWAKGHHPGADHIWELAKAMEMSGSRRQMAFSIQGKVLLRDGGRVLKAWVQDIAITPSPINPETWLELAPQLAKSLDTPHDRDVICKSISIDPDAFDDSPSVDLGEAMESHKALSVAGGSILVPQSLEGTRNATFRSYPPGHPQNNEAPSELNKSLVFAFNEFRRRNYNEHRAWQLAQAAVARTMFL